MNIFDMSISSVLDVLSYGLVLVYGLVLAAAIAGSFETARQRRIVLWLCPVFLLVQLLGWLLLGEDSVTRIYPLIVHLPLVLILVFALKRPWGVSIVSTCMAYLCCQPPHWGRVAAERLRCHYHIHSAAGRFFLPSAAVLCSRRVQHHDLLPVGAAAVWQSALHILHL